LRAEEGVAYTLGAHWKFETRDQLAADEFAVTVVAVVPFGVPRVYG
jgi:hypothetical protein